ncbi:MAG: SagB/ThcOx family dehydrogenase [Candidatus Eisenbacteria bacterium]|nr:SagB/ThcOx family dehydrogenase [Candidatus Eisenbacteria bacterium]
MERSVDTATTNLSAARAVRPDRVALPAPRISSMPVERAISGRRSVRAYSDAPIPLADLSQLLWAAQGETEAGRRAAPSAGALYPIELYVAAGRVTDLPAGLYHYDPEAHDLAVVEIADVRPMLSDAALSQEWVADAAAVVVIGAVPGRTAAKYGARAERYVHIEVGAVAENIYLQSESLGLGTVFVGAFSDEDVAGVLGEPEVEPFGLMPVGALP